MDAFESSLNIEHIYYVGNSEDWQLIENYDLDVFNNKVYYFSEVKPETTGLYWHYDTDGIRSIIW